MTRHERGTELAVVGAGVDVPGANKAYYRVVAVDDAGKRSGPSDYAAAPRPVIYSKPVVEARLGAEYRYDVSLDTIPTTESAPFRQIDFVKSGRYSQIPLQTLSANLCCGEPKYYRPKRSKP